MKRRGFTLIELLGVIIVISIIAIITRVVVLNVITSAKKESFKDTAYGIISALNYTYLNENLDQNHTSRMYIFPTDELDFNGKMPLGGQAYITADGDVSLAIYNEDWCAYRSFDEKKVSVIEYEEGACGLTTTGELALSKVEEDTKDGMVYPDMTLDLVIQFNSNGGSTVSTQYIEPYDKVSKPANPTRFGYRFLRWELNGIEYDFDQLVEENMTLNAIWEAVDTYTIIFDSKGGSTVSSQTVEVNKTASKPRNPVLSENVFLYWSLDGTSYDFNTPITQDITLEANWYTLQEDVRFYFDTNGDENYTKSIPIDLRYPESYSSLPKASKDKYDFEKWIVTLEDDDTTYEVNNNQSYQAMLNDLYTGDVLYFNPVFVEIIPRYTVTFKSNGGTYISKQTIKENELASKPADPTRCGYSFTRWTFNGIEYNFNTPITQDITLEANWQEAETYLVSFDTTGGSGVSSQCIPKGKTATYKTTSRSNYKFINWILDGEVYDFNTPVTKDITLEATWEKTQNTLPETPTNTITSYTLTYYTFGYVSSKESTDLEYIINLNNIPSSYGSYALDASKIQEIYVKNASIVENYDQLKSDITGTINVMPLTSSGNIETSIDTIQTYAVNRKYASVSATAMCNSGCTEIKISESIADLSSFTYHNTQTVSGNSTNAIYVPIKLTVKLKVSSVSSVALTQSLLASNTVQSSENINFSKLNRYGDDFEETQDTTKVEYNFLSDHYYWFTNFYTFDKKTGYYTVGEDAVNSTFDTSITQKYFCGNTMSTKYCETLYEIVSIKDSETATVKAHSSKVLHYVNNGNGLFETKVNDDTVYFFRGNVTNNYVRFAGMLWRIVRINEDGTIRLIYSDSIGQSMFNSKGNSNSYVGYMYGNSTTNYQKTHANENDSDIKQFLDQWYEEKLASYSVFIADAGFCGDRSLYSQNGYARLSTSNFTDFSQLTISDSGKGYGNNTTFYGGAYRVHYGEPSYQCINKNDLYTVSNANGNGALTYPIGLLSADELVFAAGSYSQTNRDYFLFLENKPWWTMTPQWYLYYNGQARTSIIAGVDGIYYRSIGNELYVRPVINLVKNVTITKGNGTSSNPYIIQS